MKQFTYQPLPPRHIRFLNISGNEDDLIYTIFDTNLDLAPVFTALSYTWDSQQRDQDLVCNGSILKVSKNVLRALPQLFQHDGSHNIWIDGVCINQDDESEKNIQVPLMQEIYTRTSKTVIWLGESGPNIDEAINAIPTLLSVISGSGNEEVPTRSSPIWAGLHDLFCKPWFTRVWVFQEAILPKNVEVICGQNALPIEIMIELVHAVVNAFLIDRISGGAPTPPPGVWTLKLIETYKRWRSVGEHFSFSALADMGRDLSCYDSRDKIYGLLGLAEESLRAEIVVDYQNKTAKELFLDVTKHEIANEPMLTALHLSFKSPRTDLPSWCPNYGELPTSSLIVSLAEDYHAGNRNWIKRKAVSARTTPFRARTDGKVLHVQGVCLDRVDKIVAPGWILLNHTVENIVENAKKSLAWDAECFQISQQIYKDEALDTHSRILIGNSLRRERCISDQREIYDLMRRFVAVTAGKEPVGYVEEALTPEKWKDLPDYSKQVSLACSNRTFFTMGDRRVGLGPPTLQTGDTVCIISNTFAPFIIRSTSSGRHELIGEAYVHGLMYGEIFDLVDEDKFQEILLD